MQLILRNLTTTQIFAIFVAAINANSLVNPQSRNLDLQLLLNPCLTVVKDRLLF